MQRRKFDLVVVGGGAGGLSAAFTAKYLGAKTCIIEKRRLGGDCTWSGCIPSKTLLKSASVAHLISRSKEFGMTVLSESSMKTDKVMARVRSVVHQVAKNESVELLEKEGIGIVLGNPRFLNEKEIEVGGEVIQFKKGVISTGSRPLIPKIEGLEKIAYLSNENLFDVKELPGNIIILGGGPVGVEMAQALNRLGVKVSLVEMRQRILFREDEEVSKILEQRIKEEGVQVLTGKKALSFSNKLGLVYCRIENLDRKKETISAERVLVAVGRRPNTEDLSLEESGVSFTSQGVAVNSYLQTTNKNIFACGDVVGPYLFTHVAGYQAQICVRNALLRRAFWRKVNYNNVAWALFTEPELAHLGLTEEEARKRYKGIRVYRTAFSECDRALTDGVGEGLAKVIIDSRGQIRGAHIVGAGAAEVIQGLLIAVFLKIPLAKLSEAMFVYPTLSELIKTTATKVVLEKLSSGWMKWGLRLARKI